MKNDRLQQILDAILAVYKAEIDLEARKLEDDLHFAAMETEQLKVRSSKKSRK